MTTQRHDLELEEIRSLALEALKNFLNNKQCWGGGLQQETLILEIGCIAGQKGLIPITPGGTARDTQLNDNEYMKALEVISNLMMEGVIMWGLNRSNPKPPFMSVTTYGKKVLEGENVIPHDPDGYIKTFKERVPDVDELVLTYLVEGIQTFRTNNLLASAVMLGVASEAAFNHLFDTLTQSITGPKKEKLEKLQESISTKTKFDEIMKEIERIKPNLPVEIKENIASELDGIFNLIRYQRNDAGHPTGKSLTRDEMFVSFRLFIIYCGKLYKLTKWLQNNQI